MKEKQKQQQPQPALFQQQQQGILQNQMQLQQQMQQFSPQIQIQKQNAQNQAQVPNQFQKQAYQYPNQLQGNQMPQNQFQMGQNQNQYQQMPNQTYFQNQIQQPVQIQSQNQMVTSQNQFQTNSDQTPQSQSGRSKPPKSQAGSYSSLGSFDSEGGEQVRVCVRVRPFNQQEIERGDKSCVDVQSTVNMTLNIKNTNKQYTFNHIMNLNYNQEQTFNNCGIPILLDSALDGYAATIFAYGQTGSGKTYTMAGIEDNLQKGNSDETDGLIIRSITYI